MKEARWYFWRPKIIDTDFLDNGISAITLARTVPELVWNREWDILKVLWLLRAAHVELEDTEREIIYTSTMRYGEGDKKVNGLVKRPSADVLSAHPDRWYYYSIMIHEQVRNTTFSMLDSLVADNQGYDKRYIAKFLTGPHGRKLIEKLSGKPLNDLSKFICSGISEIAAMDAVYKERKQYDRLAGLLMQLVILNEKFKGDEPDPLNLSLAFYRAGLTPISQVDHKPLIKPKTSNLEGVSLA
ncbi:MAG: hypothetical protein DRP56_07610 [Planctomycetota bacterium]|nr:MAG: hypothetical protein DRP56_07610 [Planctomycetota bacterium]